jgi:four helix bundle protein
MNAEELKLRMKRFAIATAIFCEELPQRKSLNIYSAQLIRSSSSVGANYRAACRAKSKPDFINKLKIVEEEADEFPSIVVASIVTMRSNQSNTNRKS